jgi:hypothetical protein
MVSRGAKTGDLCLALMINHEQRVIAETCRENGVSLIELRSNGHRDRLPAVRVKLAQLTQDYRWAIAEIPCQLGISTSGV